MRRAEQAAAEYRSALRLFRHATATWDPPVAVVSALEARDMDEIWSIIEEHRRLLGATSEVAAKRCDQQQAWLWSMIDDGLKRHFLERAAESPLAGPSRRSRQA